MGLSRIIDPHTAVNNTLIDNQFVIAISITAVFLSLGLMLAASVAGFYEGWRTGWAVARGGRFRDVLFDGPTFTMLRYVKVRLQRRTLSSDF